MTTINFRTFGNNFKDAAYEVIAPKERVYGPRDLIPRNIGDGYVTIGAGCNLDGGHPSVKFAVYRQLGIRVDLRNRIDAGTPAQRAAERGYVDRLNAILQNTALTAAQKVTALNTVMAARAMDNVLNGFADNRPSTFEFGTAGRDGEAQIRASFDDAIIAYNADLERKLDRKDPAIRTQPNFENSLERAVLLSLVWNGGPGLIGNGVLTGLSTGNRAEVWFQIRYNTNAGQSRIDFGQGIANRRYTESNEFRLYGNSTISV